MAHLLNSFSLFIILTSAVYATMPGATFEETGAAKAASDQKAQLEKQAQFGIFPTSGPAPAATARPRRVEPGNARIVDFKNPDYSGNYVDDANEDADEEEQAAPAKPAPKKK